MATRPFAGFEWLIAGRYLRARRKERAISAITGFSLVGIMLGVATLIVVMSVMNGFRFELVNRILGVNGHILVLPGGANIENYDALAKEIAAEPDVLRAAPIIEGRVMASSRRGNTGVLVRGVSPENAKTLEALANPEEHEGSLNDFGVDGGVAIGSGVADELGLVVGDKVKLISPRGLRTVLGPAPATIRSFRIAYIFKVGMTEYDKILMYMPLDEAQKFFLKPDRVDQIEVMVENPDDVDETVGRLVNSLTQPLRLWTWKDQNGGYLKALRTERVVMFVILSLIILVAALNIISGLIMLVKDKGRDIGILRTIGLTRGAVMRIFFICGSSIGVVGTILGVILGTLFATYIHKIQAAVEWVLGIDEIWDANTRYLSELPSILHTSDVVLTTCIALALSFLATLYPAWRAARMNPVEALRYE